MSARLNCGSTSRPKRENRPPPAQPQSFPASRTTANSWHEFLRRTNRLVMPPPDSHKQLSDRERETLRRWVAEGAEYQAHWSFIPPQRAGLPAVEHASWPRNAIDRFILARLEKEGLATVAGSRSGDTAAPTFVRLNWPSAYACGSRRVSARQQAGRVRSESSIGCSPLPISASAWRSIGSMPPALPTPMAITSTTAAI